MESYLCVESERRAQICPSVSNVYSDEETLHSLWMQGCFAYPKSSSYRLVALLYYYYTYNLLW